MAQPVTGEGFGINQGVKQQVDQLHNAGRVSLRPPEKGALGSYRLALFSGIVAAGMTGPLSIWQMRWFVSGYNALIRRVRFMAMTDSVAFAQGSAIFALHKATKFTVLDTTGGATAPTITGKDQAKSSRFGPSQLQSTGPSGTAQQAFVILSTAATGLTGGTKTLDSNPIAVMLGSVGANPLMRIAEGNLIDPTEAGREPEELSINEGLVLRCELIAATGTWKFCVEVEWDEVDPARYFKV